MSRYAIAFASLALIATAACGFGDENVPDSPDAAEPGPDAGPNPDGPDLTAATIAAVAGDFGSTGILSTVKAPSLVVDDAAVAGVAAGDPVIRRIGDELFVINRFGGDNLTILDAATLALDVQIATGAGSNPQDVAMVGDKLYIAALGRDSLLVIDRDTPTTIGEIDLSAIDDDGMPDCVSAYAVGDRVFVACGLLASFAAVEPGVVVVIDTNDDTIETTFLLPARNPFGWFEQAPATGAFAGDLLIPVVPSFSDFSTGCLARVTTDATPSALCGPTNQALGGYVNRGVVLGDAMWAVVTSSFTSGSLVRIDLTTGTAGTAINPSTQQIVDVTACAGHVFVADKATNADGLRVYAIDGTGADEITTTALDIGLPPVYGHALACMIEEL